MTRVIIRRTPAVTSTGRPDPPPLPLSTALLMALRRLLSMTLDTVYQLPLFHHFN